MVHVKKAVFLKRGIQHFLSFLSVDEQVMFSSSLFKIFLFYNMIDYMV